MNANLPTDSASPLKSRAHWKMDIELAHQAGRYVNHRLSRTLHFAKADLVAYGEWTQLWQGNERLFAVRKADKLASVGENLTSLLPLDRAEVCLPTALNTLVTLGHLDRAVWLRLIEEGRIHRKLMVKDAQALLAEYHPQPKPQPRKLDVRRIVARILRQVRLIKAKATLSESAFAMSKLNQILNPISPQAASTPIQHQLHTALGPTSNLKQAA